MPMFEVEHRVGGEVRRGLLGGCWNTRFEHAAPVRSFVTRRGTPGFSGWRWCATTGGHVGYESWLERDHLMQLDFDEAIVGISSQPFRLHWHDGHRWRGHVPDYFARRADGRGVVIDVRAEERIEPRDAEVFAATGAACAVAGWEFRRLGWIDPVLVANLRWLGGYRHPRCVRASVARRLEAVFAEPRGMFEGAEAVGDRLEVLPVLFHLLCVRCCGWI